jgi:hypothetical protein
MLEGALRLGRANPLLSALRPTIGESYQEEDLLHIGHTLSVIFAV